MVGDILGEQCDGEGDIGAGGKLHNKDSEIPDGCEEANLSGETIAKIGAVRARN